MQKLFHLITDIFFPNICALCSADNTLLCTECEQRLKKLTNTNDLPKNNFVIYDYKDKNVKKVLHKIKYKNNKDLGLRLGNLNKKKLKDILDTQNEYFLVPIPVSHNRLQERGYNQAECIARGLDNDRTKLILTRNKSTDKLKDTSSIYDRLYQIQNSMYVTNGNDLDKNAKIIIIDDITTSGATFYEAKRALLEYGYEKENIFTLAMAH